MKPVLRVLLLVLLVPLSVQSQETGTVTMVEGALRVIRGAMVMQGAESMHLRQGDILESADPGFVQLEFPGGAVVALGPSSRLYLWSVRPGRAGGKSGVPAVVLVLLSGWMKGEVGADAGTYRYFTPLLAATSHAGSVVLHSAAPTEIFVESGSAAIGAVRPGGRLGESTSARGGQFFTRQAGKGIVVASRPNSGFINGMPRYFRDTLPSRLARFAGKRPAEPRRQHEVTYPEIQSWLSMEPAWRRGFIARFESRLSDPEFRRAMDAHMSEHPEWDRILHPEKYEPKTPSNSDSRQDRE